MPMLTAVAALLLLAAPAASEPAWQATGQPVAQDDTPTTQAPLAAGPAPEQVAIPALDGGVIQADLYGQGDRGIVLAPGGSFDKGSWAGQAKVLAASGFRVLAIDFRGAEDMRAGRESRCGYDDVCLAGDVLAAVRYLRRTGATMVFAMGGSMGGAAVAQASVESNPGDIERLVLLASTTSVPERLQGRKLFIVSRGDIGDGDIPRLPRVRDQFERAPDPKELLILEGPAHAQFLFQTDQSERLMREIVRFLTAP
jgi:pimeloyl-ACP methyl ester carboxylesterase